MFIVNKQLASKEAEHSSLLPQEGDDIIMLMNVKKSTYRKGLLLVCGGSC